MQTILITGGTGLVGKALSSFLVEKGYKVIILTRNPTNNNNNRNNNISFARWDIKQQFIDIDAINSADYIIHLAGAGVMEKTWTDDYKKEIVNSRIDSSKLICEKLKQIPHKVKAVISASAIGYYGEDKGLQTAFTEEAPADNGFLGHTCKLWEQSIEPVKDLNIRLVRLRIGIVLSKKGGALKEFINPLKLGIAAILGNGKQKISWIHIEDLCRMFLFAIEQNQLQEIYNAVAPEPVTNKTLTITLAKKMKRFFFIPVYVPVFILKLLLGERSIEILKSATVSSKKIADAGFNFLYPDINSAIEEIL